MSGLSEKFSNSAITKFFDTALAGESKTYNDHNWYTNGGLRGYIEGRNSSPYSLLNKDLTKYTIGEIQQFQDRGRDSKGQLWATGRYQIIPDTLDGLLKKANINSSDKYNEENQNKLGLQLLANRSSIRKYITQEIADTKENLESASLSMAKIWASIGVPYTMKGRYGTIQKNQSYYAGGGDKASESTEEVQKALKDLRNSYGKKKFSIKESLKGGKKGKIVLYSVIGLSVLGIGIGIFYYFKTKK